MSEWFVSRFNRLISDPPPGVYETFSTGEFLRPLPDSPFWETDIVEYQGERFMVTHITSWNPEDWRYHISKKLGPGGGGSRSVSDTDLTLIERGNLWRREHSEPLHFDDVLEEAQFYMSLGEIEEVRHPIRGRWDRMSAIEAIKEGVADAPTGGGYTPLNRYGVVLIKFKDREVGERVREYQVSLIEQ